MNDVISLEDANGQIPEPLVQESSGWLTILPEKSGAYWARHKETGKDCVMEVRKYEFGADFDWMACFTWSPVNFRIDGEELKNYQFLQIEPPVRGKN